MLSRSDICLPWFAYYRKAEASEGRCFDSRPMGRNFSSFTAAFCGGEVGSFLGSVPRDLCKRVRREC
jgi:hypothetical protein